MGMEVSGSQVLYLQYKGNVCLSVLVARKVSNFLLSNILYLPGWNNMNLLSWRIIDLIGNAYLYSENKTLDIKLKTDNSIIVWANLVESVIAAAAGEYWKYWKMICVILSGIAS